MMTISKTDKKDHACNADSYDSYERVHDINADLIVRH